MCQIYYAFCLKSRHIISRKRDKYTLNYEGKNLCYIYYAFCLKPRHTTSRIRDKYSLSYKGKNLSSLKYHAFCLQLRFSKNKLGCDTPQSLKAEKVIICTRGLLKTPNLFCCISYTCSKVLIFLRYLLVPKFFFHWFFFPSMIKFPIKNCAGTNPNYRQTIRK